MPFPVHDWQFWVATGAFAFALAWLVRAVLPIPWLTKRRRGGRAGRSVPLTVEGKSTRK